MLMKKNIIIAIAACVALAACTKNELKPVEVDQQITFQAVVNKPSTKAMLTGTSYPTDATFGTVAYKVNGSTSELYIPVSEVKYYNTGSPAYWSTEAAYYWPKENGSSLTFYSYSPFYYSETGTTTAISVTAAATGLTFTNYYVKEHQETDLMVAEKKENQTSNTTTTNSWAAGVPTVFHHMLAQIEAINFQTVVDASADPVVVKDYANGHDGTSEHKYVAGDKQFVVTDVYFEKFFEQGTLTAGDSKTWATSGSVTDSYTWYSNTSSPAKFSAGICTPRTGYYLVLPQNFNDENAKLHVKYEIHTYTSASAHATEKMDVSVPLKNLNASWEMNKKYTYTLNIDLDRIYWDPKVTDWTTESTGSAEI